jgi:hypothetical protein
MSRNLTDDEASDLAERLGAQERLAAVVQEHVDREIARITTPHVATHASFASFRADEPSVVPADEHAAQALELSGDDDAGLSQDELDLIHEMSRGGDHELLAAVRRAIREWKALRSKGSFVPRMSVRRFVAAHPAFLAARSAR